jgi:hypothetical protein
LNLADRTKNEYLLARNGQKNEQAVKSSQGQNQGYEAPFLEQEEKAGQEQAIQDREDISLEQKEKVIAALRGHGCTRLL